MLRVLKSVASNRWRRLYIRLPRTDAEWARVERGFASTYGMRGVGGAIDGSLFPVAVKDRAVAGALVSRKGFMAVNYIAVCDSQ